MRIFDGVLKGLGIAVLCVVLIVLYDVHVILGQVQAIVPEVHGMVNDSYKTFDATHKRTNAILTHVDKIVGRWQQISEQVLTASRRQEEVSNKTLLMMQHGDEVLTDTDNSVKQIGNAFDEAGQSVVEAMKALTSAEVELQAAIKDFDRLLKDSNTTEEQLQVAATRLANAMGHFDSMSAQLDERLKQLLKPGSMIKNIFMTLFHLGNDVRGTLGK